jgi:hypothetical protein
MISRTRPTKPLKKMKMSTPMNKPIQEMSSLIQKISRVKMIMKIKTLRMKGVSVMQGRSYVCVMITV